jgi:Family of unknown function (DUF5926)
MQELVPAGTAELSLLGEHADRSVMLCTVLPMAWPGLVRKDGAVMVAAQTQTSSGDASRDLGDALSQALTAEAGTSIPPRPLPVDAPRIQDLVEPSSALRVIVHSRFDYWFDETEEQDEATTASLERAEEALIPTARLATVEAGYWMMMGERRQLRWVLPGGEDAVVDAMARLLVSDGLSVGDGSRYLGSFRSLGLLTPVWDLADGVEVDDVEEPAADFESRLEKALLDTSALDGAMRRARESLLARQLTAH